MQPSDTAKDVPAKRNGSLGIVPAKLGFGPCWINGRKDKNEQGTFLIIIIYLQAGEERYVAQFRFIGVCNAGIEDRGERCGVTIIQATYESRHRADLTRD